MGYQTIKLESTDDIALLQLKRPDKLNALTIEAARELHDAVQVIAATDAYRCVLISGQGRAFCAGADLSGGNESAHPLGALGEIYNSLFSALMALDKPTVCAVHGACAGAGVSLAMSCDITIAARSAYFVQAFINAALVPDTGASWLLPRLMGRSKAAGMLLLGKRLAATQAAEWGLIWDVVHDDSLAEDALAIARQLAGSAPAALRLTKTLLRESARNTYVEQLGLEARLQRIAEQGEEHREAVKAFFEKRPARFSR
jgi:2-(1,2-epoxy-1,2-dihydrophenyl)acetyl-CoA isomerase